MYHVFQRSRVSDLRFTTGGVRIYLSSKCLRAHLSLNMAGSMLLDIRPLIGQVVYKTAKDPKSPSFLPYLSPLTREQSTPGYPTGPISLSSLSPSPLSYQHRDPGNRSALGDESGTPVTPRRQW